MGVCPGSTCAINNLGPNEMNCSGQLVESPNSDEGYYEAGSTSKFWGTTLPVSSTNCPVADAATRKYYAFCDFSEYCAFPKTCCPGLWGPKRMDKCLGRIRWVEDPRIGCVISHSLFTVFLFFYRVLCVSCSPSMFSYAVFFLYCFLSHHFICERVPSLPCSLSWSVFFFLCAVFNGTVLAFIHPSKSAL